MDGTVAFRLAKHASAFQRKLARLSEDTDPARRQGSGPWAALGAIRDSSVRARTQARLFPRLFGPWPALERLDERAPRLALLDRDRLLQQLCLLALAARPGALRCCIAREPRQALRAVLGEAFEQLLKAGQRGRAVPPAAAAWTPAHWACLGYLDWQTLLNPKEDLTLRRLAEASLPPGLLGVPANVSTVPRERTAAQAVAHLDELSLEWSC
jgi:hypothetical protein